MGYDVELMSYDAATIENIVVALKRARFSDLDAEEILAFAQSMDRLFDLKKRIKNATPIVPAPCPDSKDDKTNKKSKKKTKK